MLMISVNVRSLLIIQLCDYMMTDCVLIDSLRVCMFEMYTIMKLYGCHITAVVVKVI